MKKEIEGLGPPSAGSSVEPTKGAESVPNRRLREEVRALRRILKLIPTLSRASRNWLSDQLQRPIPPEHYLWQAILDQPDPPSSEQQTARPKAP